jgi:hypothetical protein
MPPRRVGGQPLHPIYAPLSRAGWRRLPADGWHRRAGASRERRAWRPGHARLSAHGDPVDAAGGEGVTPGSAGKEDGVRLDRLRRESDVAALRPLPCSIRIPICWGWTSLTRRWPTSETCGPPACMVMNSARCLRLLVAVKRAATSWALRNSGSLLARGPRRGGLWWSDRREPCLSEGFWVA